MFVNRFVSMYSQIRGGCNALGHQRVFSTVFPFSNTNTGAASNTGLEATTTQQPNFSTSSLSDKSKPPITKTKIAEEIAHNHDLTLSKSQRIVNTVLDTIMEAVADDQKVVLKSFGTFDSYMSKERQGTHPGTKERITIPSKRRIRFKASSTFRKSTNE